MFKSQLYEKSKKSLDNLFFEQRQLKRVIGVFPVDLDYIKDIAHIKRLLERFCADPKFKKSILNGDFDIVKEYNIDIDPEEVRFKWDNDYALKCTKDNIKQPLSVQKYQAWIQEKIVHRDQIREQGAVPENKKFRIWRERQNNRIIHRFGVAKGIRLVHPTFDIELSKGCSGSCWFCGFGAVEKEGDYLYTEENKKEFRDILKIFKEILGKGASAGFLYSASDPLDNKDYEKFMMDYAYLLGAASQITTALATRDIERTRKLLWLNHRLGSDVDRFSVTSLGMLNKIHSNFTPEELLFIELLHQNIESTSMMANAGRAVEHENQMTKKAKSSGNDAYIHQAEENGDTIACMSGFQLNMFDRTVELITPSESNKKWPNGYWVVNHTKFKDANDLREIINNWIEKYMLEELENDSPIAFLKGYDLEISTDYISLTSCRSKVEVDYNEVLPGLKEIASIIDSNKYTAKQIVYIMKEKHNQKESDTWDTLNLLFQDGLFDEEPDFFFN
jgi:radical SAM family RiPP maturation amino acid epimerase